ncbi:hypothetical protein ARMSODRAFT_76674 [Armillaria solidipes]|uniref:Uncharacterized protein n=1 Tax=Armillaria solidipes TaxID=1076256 RepID=A0A2H3C865_9AGAR|nr:hypothetical protein ARMSODRAFT_76674 [Armillaria solidipes]
MLFALKRFRMPQPCEVKSGSALAITVSRSRTQIDMRPYDLSVFSRHIAAFSSRTSFLSRGHSRHFDQARVLCLHACHAVLRYVSLPLCLSRVNMPGTAKTQRPRRYILVRSPTIWTKEKTRDMVGAFKLNGPRLKHVFETELASSLSDYSGASIRRQNPK